MKENNTSITEDEVIKAIKTGLSEDFTNLEREDLEVEVTSMPNEHGKYIQASVTTEPHTVFTDYMPSYIQAFRIGGGHYDISIVAEPEQLGIE